MEKPDLKVGMIVKLRNDDVCLVTRSIYGELFLVNEYDVMKVYEILGKGFDLRTLLNPSEATHKLLWERKETKEMTVAEISEALGYEVKVVKS